MRTFIIIFLALMISNIEAKESKLLECKGTFTFCGLKSNLNICDKPETTLHVIEFDGHSIKHIDDYGILNFKTGCSFNESMINCEEMTSSDNRSLTISRVTGDLSYKAILKLHLNSPPPEKDEINKITIEGRCLPRANRNMF
jgi:hypothetical protein